jgi:hypothetical protein
MIDQIYEMEGVRVESWNPSSQNSQGLNSLSLKSDDIPSFLKEDRVYTIQELLEKSKFGLVLLPIHWFINRYFSRLILSDFSNLYINCSLREPKVQAIGAPHQSTKR